MDRRHIAVAAQENGAQSIFGDPNEGRITASISCRKMDLRSLVFKSCKDEWCLPPPGPSSVDSSFKIQPGQSSQERWHYVPTPDFFPAWQSKDASSYLIGAPENLRKTGSYARYFVLSKNQNQNEFEPKV